MQFMAQRLVCKDSNNSNETWETVMKQHFQRGQASTKLEINKLNDWH